MILSSIHEEDIKTYKALPAKGAEYALLQRKYQFDNIQQTVASHRERDREKEKYLRASHRNSLEQQRANVLNGVERLPAPTRQYYIEQIANLDNKIQKQKTYPNFKSTYDMAKWK